MKTVLLHGKSVRAGFAADGQNEPSSSSYRRERQQGWFCPKECVARNAGLHEKVADVFPVLGPCRILWLPARERLACREVAGKRLHQLAPASADPPLTAHQYDTA
jgi:hypothetical protein